jgi:hypothetical protein
MLAVDRLIHAAQEIDGLEIFFAAVPVGKPLPCSAAVIEI